MPSGTPSTEAGGWLFTCRHLDELTGDCLIYESRPGMCRDYPYSRPCGYPGCSWSRGRAGTWPPTGYVKYTEADGVSRVRLRVVPSTSATGAPLAERPSA